MIHRYIDTLNFKARTDYVVLYVRKQRPDQLLVQTAPLCVVKPHPEALAVPDQAEAGLERGTSFPL